jgi:hypothetical protein
VSQALAIGGELCLFAKPGIGLLLAGGVGRTLVGVTAGGPHAICLVTLFARQAFGLTRQRIEPSRSSLLSHCLQ